MSLIESIKNQLPEAAFDKEMKALVPSIVSEANAKPDFQFMKTSENLAACLEDAAQSVMRTAQQKIKQAKTDYAGVQAAFDEESQKLLGAVQEVVDRVNTFAGALREHAKAKAELLDSLHKGLAKYGDTVLDAHTLFHNGGQK